MWTWMNSLQWRDVPTAVGSIGTAAAAWWAVRTYKTERADDARTAVAEVVAWLEADREDYDSRAVFVVVQNNSARPVFDVTLRSTGIEAQPEHWEIIPPGRRERLRANEDMVPAEDSFSASVALSFTDTFGRRWRREGPTHELQRV